MSVDKCCNKRGQTSRRVVGNEIQKSCNFKANLRDLLGCVRCLFNSVFLEFSYNHMAYLSSCILVSCNLSHLLHKDRTLPSSSSSSVTRLVSTTEPNKSIEHSAMQKGRLQCDMVANDAGRLLSSLSYSGGFGP